MKYLRTLWRNKFDFKGTATTKEFFLSLLANWAAMMVLLPVPAILLLGMLALGIGGNMLTVVGITVYMAVFLLPVPALTARRMRDSGHPIWYQLLMILGIPLYGLLLVGLLKPGTRKHCFLSKLAYVLLPVGFGGILWSFLLFHTEVFEPIAMGMLLVIMVGIIVGGIGGKIDDVRNQAISEGGRTMTRYKELFVSQFLSQDAYAAVIYDCEADAFFDALFTARTVGGGISYSLQDKGAPITPGQVRKLAEKSEDCRAESYTGITEDNWRELTGAELSY